MVKPSLPPAPNAVSQFHCLQTLVPLAPAARLPGCSSVIAYNRQGSHKARGPCGAHNPLLPAHVCGTQPLLQDYLFTVIGRDISLNLTILSNP